MSFAIHVKPKSIRTQLTLWYLLMLGSALAAFATAVFLIRVATLSREVDAELNIHAQHLVAVLEPRLLELDPVLALANDQRLFEEPFIVRARSGAPVYTSPTFPPLRGVDDAAAVRAARGGDGLMSADDSAGNTFRLATLLVERTGAAPLVVQVAAPTEPDRAILRQLAATMLVLFVLVLAAASYGGSFIARRALRPVDAIVGRVRAIQASRLEERLDVRTGSEELDRLVDTLNGMLDRLETSMHGARRFAADASHELQTPIAAMRAALDVGLRDELTAPEHRALAGEIVADVDRLWYATFVCWRWPMPDTCSSAPSRSTSASSSGSAARSCARSPSRNRLSSRSTSSPRSPSAGARSTCGAPCSTSRTTPFATRRMARRFR